MQCSRIAPSGLTVGKRQYATRTAARKAARQAQHAYGRMVAYLRHCADHACAGFCHTARALMDQADEDWTARGVGR